MNNAAVASFDSVQLVKGEASKEAQLSLPKKNLGKRAIIVGASIFLALTGLVAGTMSWQYASAHESTDDAFVDGDLTQISSRIPGTVAQVLVSDNQYVKAGQAMIKLDPRDFQIKVAQAKAALEKAERQAAADNADISVTASNAGAQAITASSEVSHASAAIDDARSGVITAKAELGMETEKLISMQAQQRQYATDLQRYSNLVSQGAISQQQYDQAKTQNDVSIAQIDAEKHAIEVARSKVIKANADLQQAFSDQKKTAASAMTAVAGKEQTHAKSLQSKVAQAAVNQAKADLANAELQLSYTTIFAPSSGRVGKKSVQAGEQIQSGQALYSLIPDTAWITANFKETQISHMKPHEQVDITLDAIPDHHFKGYIDSLSPASGNEFALLPADNATGNFTKTVQRVPIKIAFDQNSIASYKQFVMPGLSAQVSVDLNKL